MSEDFFKTVANSLDEKFDADCIDSLPLAMAYVPMQKWQDIYSTDVGFDRGTIFSQLDKPFLGRRGLK